MSAVPIAEVRRPKIRLWSAVQATDLDAVYAVEARAYPWPWSRKHLADSLAAGHRMELLRSPDALIGYSVAMRAVDELHLLNLTVAPEFQGQGHGRALLHRVVQYACENALSGIWLEVRLSNERAQALYEREGFVRVNQRRAYYPRGNAPREDAWVMHRNLEARP